MNNKKLIIFCVGLLTATVLIFTVLLMKSNVRLSVSPTVGVKPDNCYTETLKVITDKDYRPFSFYDETGTPSGHDIELITIIANRLHMNLDLRMMSWYEGIDAINRGEADVLMTCDFTDSFKGTERLLKTESTSMDDFTVFSRNRLKKDTELYGKRIAYMKNGNVRYHLREMGLEKNSIGYEDNRAAIMAVKNGEADCAIMRNTVGLMITQEHDLTKITPDFSIGQSFMCFDVVPDKPELRKEIDKVLHQMKLEGEMKDLSEKWLTTFVRPYTFWEILSSNRWALVMLFLVIIAIILTILFSTMRQARIKAAHVQSENAYQNVIRALSDQYDLVCLIDISGDTDKETIFKLNEARRSMLPGWEHITNFTDRLEYFNKYLVHPDDRELFRSNTQRAHILEEVSKQQKYSFNYRNLYNGEVSFWSAQFSLTESDGTKLVAGFIEVTDETLKHMKENEELRAARDKAEVASRAKTEFLFNMSHDLRTPMNAILGFSDIAKKNIGDDEKTAEAIDKIKTSGTQLLKLLNHVLELSRIEAGQREVKASPCDIVQEVKKIVASFEPNALLKGHTLDSTFKVTDPYVLLDTENTSKILLNILSNATKYTPSGGKIHFTLEQLPEREDGKVPFRWTVSDNGIGMSAEFKEHIFERFSRERSTTESGIEGTGLGMTMVKEFTDLMNGTVDVQSRPGKGSTISFTLPLEKSTESLVAAKLDGKVNYGYDPDSDTLEGKKVLLVEDNVLNSEIASVVLQDIGLEVDTAEDGTIAIDKLREKGPKYYDFVLMDIQMPIMNGYTATRAIREMYPYNHIPIIALSANAFEEDKKKSLEAGMDDHVAKPIDVAQLTAALKKLV